jgi:hypothetical protein
MEIRDNGKHAVFEGRVRSFFTPQDEPAADTAAASAEIRTKIQ